MASTQQFLKGQIVSTIGPGEVERYKLRLFTEHKVVSLTVKHDLDNLRR